MQARFDRLEALLKMRSSPSPSDLLETLVDYFVMENVPISRVDGQFFMPCLRAGPDGRQPYANARQLRAAIL
jgi:hypothetical protein